MGVKEMRRNYFCKGVAGMTVIMAALVLSILTPVLAQRSEDGWENDDNHAAAVGKIYELQAAFHRAKTTQDINLMMSLWDADATLNVQGDPNSPYIGFDRIKAFWLTSGSFTHNRFSLVPSFKTQINVEDDQGSLYFECHDVGNFDQPNRSIVADTFLSGTVRKQGRQWVFSNMTAGKSSPLSVDHYYFP